MKNKLTYKKFKKMFNNEKEKQELKISIFILIFICSIFMLLYSGMLFYSGFHSLDLAQNMKYMECEFNVSIMDLHSNYNIYDKEYMYIKGFNNMRAAFFIAIYCSFVIGSSLQLIFTEMFKIKKK